MPPDDPHSTPLNTLEAGSRGCIAEICGGRTLTRRLLALGLRPGVEVTVLYRRGQGLVVTAGDARVALGGGIADSIRVTMLPPLSSG